MSVKRKVIDESIRRINKRIGKIDEILSAHPLGRICEIRIEAIKLIKDSNDDYSAIQGHIKRLAAEEKECFAMAKKQQKTLELIDEKVKLQSELGELSGELAMMSIRGRV